MSLSIEAPKFVPTVAFFTSTIGEPPVTTNVSSMSAICIVTFIVMVLLTSTFAPS